MSEAISESVSRSNRRLACHDARARRLADLDYLGTDAQDGPDRLQPGRSSRIPAWKWKEETRERKKRKAEKRSKRSSRKGSKRSKTKV